MVEGNLLFGAIAGIAGTIIMDLLMFGLRAAGQNIDFAYLLGTRFVDIDDKNRVYLAGYVLHLFIGAGWGAMYVLTLTAMGVNPDWPAGILWGFAHGIFTGVMMSTMAETHPYIGENKPISEPGILGHRWSELMPYWILGLHVVFGVVTLLTYQLIFKP